MKKESIISSSYPSSKTFFIENLGCSKNQVDAETMVASLKDEGWSLCEDSEAAELIIVNTCGFIQSAKEEAIESLLGFSTRYPGKKVLAAGCFAQRYNEKLMEKIPELDGVFGNRAPRQIGQILPDLFNEQKPVLMPEADMTTPDRKDFYSFERSVYVKIAEGCNNRCRFCAIPLIKGDLMSRPLDDVLREIRNLLSDGAFELNLVAQDLAGFGTDRGGNELMALLRGISALKGEFWLRMLYIHPDRFLDEILDIAASDSRILPYFDLPFQHADSAVLKKMGRKGDSETYLALIEKIRSRLPDAVIRSTFMVGFPGEDNRAFDRLLDFQQKAQLDWAGVFIFSREEDTPAYKDRGIIGTKMIKKTGEKRKARVEEAQQKITELRLDRYIGQKMNVLIEEKVQEEEGLYIGRTSFQAPEVDGLVVLHAENVEPGDVVPSQILRRNGVDLEAAALDDGNLK